eukprot:TRINITY_DN6921_c0_g1_i3.p1 TRINITY_DN6921_c0_g1~~TRINITY_DN6921_c0_g1_i3.p1  ORF type:complete len:213 (+),score=43.79 TRINITY_DN6921_c0_g1_i3:66-704(+)
MAEDTATMDALPYIDNDLDLPGMREAVADLIEEEKATLPFDEEKYTGHLKDVFFTAFQDQPLVQAEHQRIMAQEPFPAFDAVRYNMPAPSANRVKSLDAWKESISNARAQLQHQMTRIENLELMTNYGGQKWTRYVDQLEKLKAQVEVEVTQAREALEQLNWERQQEQTKAGQELYELELQWGELIMKNYQLEVRSRTVGPVCRCSVMECFE